MKSQKSLCNMTEEEIKKNLGQGEDLRGQIFGCLTPLYPLKERQQRKVVWHCKCSCNGPNSECNILSTNLKAHRTLSCGHLVKEVNSQIRRQFSPKIGDIINNSKILKVEYRNEGFRDENECWVLAKCQFCDSPYWVRAAALKSENTKSCGCARKSSGEALIEKILIENNISFEKEKTFKNCYYSQSNAKCRFDFYVDNKYLIEYDGKQHFYKNGELLFGEDCSDLIKNRDVYKNNWCKENDIPLIRIPYTHYHNLILEDLLLETSEWRVV